MIEWSVWNVETRSDRRTITCDKRWRMSITLNFEWENGVKTRGDQFLYSCEWDTNFVLNSLIHCLSVNKVISEWEWYGEILEFRWRHMWQNREQVQVGDDWFSRTIEQERAAKQLVTGWMHTWNLDLKRTSIFLSQTDYCMSWNVDLQQFILMSWGVFKPWVHSVIY